MGISFQKPLIVLVCNIIPIIALPSNCLISSSQSYTCFGNKERYKLLKIINATRSRFLSLFYETKSYKNQKIFPQEFFRGFLVVQFIPVLVVNVIWRKWKFFWWKSYMIPMIFYTFDLVKFYFHVSLTYCKKG